MAVSLEQLEAAALDLILDGDEPMLVALRVQRAQATISSRRLTGVGFFSDFEVPDTAPMCPRLDHVLSGPEIRMPELEHGAGLVLFVREGRLCMLEGFTYVEPWPAELTAVDLVWHDEARQITRLR